MAWPQGQWGNSSTGQWWESQSGEQSSEKAVPDATAAWASSKWQTSLVKPAGKIAPAKAVLRAPGQWKMLAAQSAEAKAKAVSAEARAKANAATVRPAPAPGGCKLATLTKRTPAQALSLTATRPSPGEGVKRAGSQPPAVLPPKKPKPDPATAFSLKACLKQLSWAVKGAWESTDNFENAIAVFKAEAAKGDAQKGEAKMKSAELVEIPLMKKFKATHYAQALALCVELGARLDVRYVSKLMGLLTNQTPVSTSMVRLTLNMALQSADQVIPLVEDGSGAVEVGDPDEAEALQAIVEPASMIGMGQLGDTAAAAYYGHFCALLHLETLVELRDLQKRWSRPLPELVQSGNALRGLRVKWFDAQGPSKHKAGAKVAGIKKKVRLVFQSPPGVDWSRVRFRPGDCVALSRTDPLKDQKCEGMVATIPASGEEAYMDFVIMLDTDLEQEAARQGTWRVDKAPNRTAYDRQMAALMKLANGGSLTRPPLWSTLLATCVGGENVDAWVAKMNGTGSAASLASLSSDSSSSKGAEELVRLAGVEPQLSNKGAASLLRVRESLAGNGELPSLGGRSLNPSQRQAVSAALGRRLTLIQGPPGTGKTHVSTCLLSLWVKEIPECWPMLATSGSNIAVDNLAEGALRLGLKVVRIGRPEKVSPQLEEVTLEALLKKHVKGEDSPAILDDTEAIAGGSPPADDATEAAATGGWQADDAAEGKMSRMEAHTVKMKILNEADIVCATTVVAGSDMLSQMSFSALLIDEVAQATEIAVIVPLILRNPQRLVLVGDHCQLPPNTCSREAEQRGLTLSLFSRLASQGLETQFLDTQFRMHPKIAEFSARQFYDGRLKTGITAEDRPALEGFKWPVPDCGVAFINIEGTERRDSDSYANDLEAEAVSEVLEGVLRAGLSVLEIGVVSPYSAQVRSMRQNMRRSLAMRLKGSDVDLSGGLQGKRAAHALEIASVDAFQGREKDLIVFSAVRSNWGNKVGFLGDWRRLNVMLTRARRGIIIIGNAKTLRGDATWTQWLNWAKESKLVANPVGMSARISARCPSQGKAQGAWDAWSGGKGSAWSADGFGAWGGDDWSGGWPHAGGPHALAAALFSVGWEEGWEEEDDSADWGGKGSAWKGSAASGAWPQQAVSKQGKNGSSSFSGLSWNGSTASATAASASWSKPTEPESTGAIKMVAAGMAAKLKVISPSLLKRGSVKLG